MITLNLRIGEGPVIDLTMAGARPDVYGPVLKDLIASDNSEVVVSVVGSSAQFRPEVAVRPIVTEAKQGANPVAVFCVPEAAESLKALADAGIAGFRTPESCADAVRAYLDWRVPAAEASPRAATRAAVEAAAALLDEAPSRHLDEAASLTVFQTLGIASVPTRLVKEDGAVSGVEFPAAAKVLSADVAHKTETGGVVLGIPNSAALRRAIVQIRERVAAAQPKARIAGVLVQKMETGVAEALVGYCVDPEAGPLVLLGAGGTLTELYDDVAVRLAPVDRDTALAMIGEVRGLAPVLGYRNLPKGDAAALAAALEAMSWLAYIKGVAEAEINPLIVKQQGQGVAAVDGLIVLTDG